MEDEEHKNVIWDYLDLVKNTPKKTYRERYMLLLLCSVKQTV